MGNNYYTEDLSRFGSRERSILKNILIAWETHGLPDGFDDDRVKPAFNTASGYVFLVNGEYQTAMLDGDVLRLWHNLPCDGEEGFLADLMEANTPDDLHNEDAEYIRNAPEFEGLLSSGDYLAWTTKEIEE